jgi:hypothetical protein
MNLEVQKLQIMRSVFGVFIVNLHYLNVPLSCPPLIYGYLPVCLSLRFAFAVFL